MSQIFSNSGGGGTVSIGGPVISGTAGSVLFINPANTLAQDNANLFWSDAANFLGIGTNSPTQRLSVNGNANVLGQAAIGSVIDASAALAIKGAINTAINLGKSIFLDNTFNFTQNDDVIYGLYAENTLNAGAFINGLYSGVAISDPDISSGSIISSFGLYVFSMTRGTETNYGLWIDPPSGGSLANVGAYIGGSVGISVTQPNSTLQLVGSFSASIVTKVFADSPYTALSTDYTILCDAVGGSMTINLPSSVGLSGRMYNIKKVDASANTVTIDANGGQLVDGAATKVITAQYESYTIQSDNANWSII